MAQKTSPTDAVWRQAFRSEAGANQGFVSAAIVWDFFKCYEKVQHHLLAHEARMVKFLLSILRVSLEMYSWARILAADGLTAAPLFSWAGYYSGIRAGHL